MARSITVIGLERIGLVKKGDSVAQLIVGSIQDEGLVLEDNDVVVISQKIISKADGLTIDLSTVKPSQRAKQISKRSGKDARLVELILKDSSKVLRVDKQMLVVMRKDGFVCLNAGVDKSNVNGRQFYTILPLDSDASATKIRIELERLTGKRLSVIVGDTYSRPQRVGQTEYAIGVSGLNPIEDYRGRGDLFGYELKFKYVALADEIAAAAELVMGQGSEGVPVAIVRGLTRIERSERAGLSKRLLLQKQRDIFSKSG
ncbi:MAG TPA: coenzyme F420-0:L-glutamate ligase [Candidatus Acidoferrales bacterium]|nr:coenzyme F420-0:L-glutamate ligase [Candidatus Acidoferrales bacterium]